MVRRNSCCPEEASRLAATPAGSAPAASPPAAVADQQADPVPAGERAVEADRQLVRGMDVVERARDFLGAHLDSGDLVLPAGVSYTFAGSFENQVRSERIGPEQRGVDLLVAGAGVTAVDEDWRRVRVGRGSQTWFLDDTLGRRCDHDYGQ